MQGCVGSGTGAARTGVRNRVQVPLHFWFCRNPGLALPLIALQYHEVKVKLTWNATNTNHSTVPAAGAVANTAELWADYIYLDTDERRRFAQVSHEYLIEQVQTQVEGTAQQRFDLNFNHPVKELVWTNANTNDIGTARAKLTLNGHDRFSEQNKEYFQLRQPMDHHSAVPRQNLPVAARALFPFDSGLRSNINSFVGDTAVANAAVTANTVQVFTGTTVINNSAGITAASIATPHNAPATTATQTYVLAFLNSDLPNVQEGDILSMIVTGAESAPGTIILHISPSGT
jgi:hypothetical protein